MGPAGFLHIFWICLAQPELFEAQVLGRCRLGEDLMIKNLAN